MRKLANHAARDIASPAVKMGNKGLFPGVAVPLAFFGTFFRVERKYYPPSGRQPHPLAPESARQSPRGQGFAPAGAPKGFPLALWKPSVRPLKQSSAHRAASPSPAPESARQTPPRGISYDKVVAYRCKQGGFPRGKQSARQAHSPKAQGPPFPGDPCAFFIPLQPFPFSSVPIVPRPPSSIP